MGASIDRFHKTAVVELVHHYLKMLEIVLPTFRAQAHRLNIVSGAHTIRLFPICAYTDS